MFANTFGRRQNWNRCRPLRCIVGLAALPPYTEMKKRWQQLSVYYVTFGSTCCFDIRHLWREGRGGEGRWRQQQRRVSPLANVTLTVREQRQSVAQKDAVNHPATYIVRLPVSFRPSHSRSPSIPHCRHVLQARCYAYRGPCLSVRPSVRHTPVLCRNG